MNFYTILAAFLAALLLSFIFALISVNHKFGKEIIISLVIVFVLGCAGHLWIKPFGPAIWGILFFPVLFRGVTIFIARSRHNSSQGTPKKPSAHVWSNKKLRKYFPSATINFHDN
jgi:branched-subunit amino acid ABC-type transport system permease component